jgi:hypothetical protein
MLELPLSVAGLVPALADKLDPIAHSPNIKVAAALIHWRTEGAKEMTEDFIQILRRILNQN